METSNRENDLEILRVINRFYPSVTGPANQAYHISLNLEKRGVHSPIFTTNYGAEAYPSVRSNSIEVHRFPVHGKFLQFMITPQMVSALMAAKPEIIHAHGYRTFQSTIAYLASKKKGIPFVVNPHGSALAYEVMVKTMPMKMPFMLYDIVTSKSILKDADCVVASSQQEFNELLQFGVEAEKLEKIPVGIDVDKYDAARPETRESSHILFVGRITRNRNLDLLLDAFALVAKRRENVKLTIVGGEARSSFLDRTGYLDVMKRKVETMRLHSKVEFTGPLYGNDLINAYKSADVFLYTSLYESFGQTILEAAASGLPIISTPVGVANDLIVHGTSGFFASFNDPAEISEKILLLLQNRRLRSKFSRNIKAIVREKYSWDEIVNRYLRIYDRLASCD